MSTAVSWNGLTYNVPGTGDSTWSGTSGVDGLLISLAQNGFQKTGGLFTLSADVDYGPLAGPVALYFKTRSSNLATTGNFRFANGDTIAWRNNANSANLALTVNASDNLLFNGNQIISSVGALTASRAVATNGSGVLVTVATTSTELGYVAGVTSAIQTQIDLKAPKASPVFTGTIGTPLTVSRVLTTDGSSNLAASSVTTTTLAFLDATSSIQTQINTKAPSAAPTFTGSMAANCLSVLGGTATDSSTVCLATGGTLISGVNAQSYYSFTVFPSTTTTRGAAFFAQPGTAAAAFTCAKLYGFLADIGTVGAGSAVTRYVNFRATPVTTAGQAALLSDNDAFSGNANISITSTNPSSIAGVVTFPTQLIGKGTATNDSASAGYIGEIVESKVTVLTNAFGNGIYGNIASISLTAGDWDVFGMTIWSANGATVAQVNMAVTSTTAGTGTVGDTYAAQVGPTANNGSSVVVPCVRFSLSGTTTIYLTGAANYSAGTPQYAGRITARRVR